MLCARATKREKGLSSFVEPISSRKKLDKLAENTSTSSTVSCLVFFFSFSFPADTSMHVCSRVFSERRKKGKKKKKFNGRCPLYYAFLSPRRSAFFFFLCFPLLFTSFSCLSAVRRGKKMRDRADIFFFSCQSGCSFSLLLFFVVFVAVLFLFLFSLFFFFFWRAKPHATEHTHNNKKKEKKEGTSKK